MAQELKPIRLSRRVVVSDPCYTRDTWCMGFLENVKPGKYKPILTYTDETGGWGERVAEVAVFHESAGYISDSRWEKADFEVGVDSGQAGIFSDYIYPTGKDTGEYDDKTSFYGACCEATLGEGYKKFSEWAEKGQKGTCPEWLRGGTILNEGVVSSSGYGDGEYECYFAQNTNGEIVAIKIVFIQEEEVEEDDFEDEYYDSED